MAVEILSPSLGSFVLSETSAPSSITYLPPSTVRVSGDGDVDEWVLSDDISTVYSGAGFLDSSASANQILDFYILMITESSNAKIYTCSITDSVTEGAKNAGAGCYIENRAGRLKFGNISDGTKYTFNNNFNSGNAAFMRYTYDPAADELTLEWFSDSARTSLVEASSALDMSAGDSQAGGFSFFQAMDVAPRGKGTALYEYQVGGVDYNQGGGSTPTDIIATNKVLLTTSNAASIFYDVSVSVTNSVLSISPINSGVSLASNIKASKQDVSATANSATIKFDAAIKALSKAISLSSNAATVSLGIAIDASKASLSSSEYQATITLDASIAATNKALSMATQPATIGLGFNILASLATPSLSTNKSQVSLDYDFGSGCVSLTLTTNQASIALAEKYTVHSAVSLGSGLTIDTVNKIITLGV